jgi:hypothetical protein
LRGWIMIGSEVDRYFTVRIFYAFLSSIRRSIQYARDNPGEEGILAALGLLCYTEVLGGFINGSWEPRMGQTNFNAFFDRLGPEYAAFRKELPSEDAYTLFRCGLAHEGAVKEPCWIRTLRRTETCGVWKDPGGGYIFSVEKYFADFEREARRLYEELMAGGKLKLPRRKPPANP